MKKITFFILIVFLILNCSTMPYLKQSELPGKVKYYSNDKQFSIKPEWFWRTRPSKFLSETIGYFYIKGKSKSYKNENGIVIGELEKGNEKYYVVKWNNNGFYFVKEKDYLFAIKYEKYKVKIQYDDISVYGIHSSKAYSEPMTSYLRNYYYRESYFFIEQYFKKLSYNVFSFFSNPSTGLIQRGDLVFTPTQKQLFSRRHGGYSNNFLIITSNIDFNHFSLNKEINCTIVQLPSSFLKKVQYENNYGQVFNGNAYKTIFIVARWGDVYYAFPCK